MSVASYRALSTEDLPIDRAAAGSRLPFLTHFRQSRVSTSPEVPGEGPQPLSSRRTARKPGEGAEVFLNEIERRRDAAGLPLAAAGPGLLPRPGEALTSHSSYLILSVSFQSIFMDWRERKREREDLVLPAFPYGGGGAGRRGERGWRRLCSAPVRARRSPSNGGNFSLFQLFTHRLIASLAYQQQPNCSPAQQPAAMDTGRKDPGAKRTKKKRGGGKKKKSFL